MKVYIKIDEDNKIISCDTNKFGDLISVDIDEELFDSMKILNCSYIDGQVVYNEDNHRAYNNNLNYINGSKIYAGTVAAAQIAANAITADKIAAKAITAAKMNITSLSAISANLGSITGGSINIGNGKFVVTSAGVVTATSGTIGGLTIEGGGLTSQSTSDGRTTKVDINDDGSIQSTQTGGEMNYSLLMTYGMISMSATPNDGAAGSWSKQMGTIISGGLINFSSGLSESVASFAVDPNEQCVIFINGGSEQPIFELVGTVSVTI